MHLLEQIGPYLRSYKAARAALILRDYLALTPRNGKYTAEQRQIRTRFESAVLELKPG